MSKRKLASVAVAALLLGSGAAVAAQSAFPQSVQENGPLSIPLMAERPVGTQTSVWSAFPSSPSEATPFTFSANAQPAAPEQLGNTHGSVFPSSVNETGARI